MLILRKCNTTKARWLIFILCIVDQCIGDYKRHHDDEDDDDGQSNVGHKDEAAYNGYAII